IGPLLSHAYFRLLTFFLYPKESIYNCSPSLRSKNREPFEQRRRAMGSNHNHPAPAAQIPTSFGHELRACLRCRLVKTYDQFRESGCENCPFFKMEEDHEHVVDCTTPNFNGSWAARWLRIGIFSLFALRFHNNI
ncbi:unnamed protein product, partial [Linum tenue]